MLVSKKALAKVIPELLNIDDELITKAFNNSGCEVERIIKHDRVDNLVIGKILKVEKHPNADKLHVCTVQLDQNGTTHTIVCGAENVQVDKYVIVALQDAKMVDGRIIQYKELRGVLSQGMICAYQEITRYVDFLSPSESRNIILIDEAAIGDTDVYKYINLDDTIYDLSLPSNRNDLNSIFSICQELSGYFDLGFNNTLFSDTLSVSDSLLKVEFNKNICSGICFLELDDFKLTQSDWQTKSFLMNNGIVPVNNLIDKLSIISLYCNCSINIYDCNKTTTGLYIDLANCSETVTINNKKYTLLPTDIVIKNKNNLLGLAGIGSFDEYKVTDETKDILIEIGNYDFVHIRNTINRLNLSSENGKRLTKPLSNFHLCQALELFDKVFGKGYVSKGFEFLPINDPKKIKVDFVEAASFLGIDEQEQEIKTKLTKYGYKFENNEITIPSYRLDVTIFQDVYEEILKIADIDKIKGKPVFTKILLNDVNVEFNKLSEIKELLNSNYFNETRNYNLVNKSSLDTFNVFHYTDYVKIANASNSNREYLRTNLIESLLDVYKFNLSYKNKLLPIYEIQKIYAGNNVVTNLTCLTPDFVSLDKVNKSGILYNTDSLKSIINSIGNLFNVKFDYFPSKVNECFYPDETLSIYCCGQLIGFVGRIKQSKLRPYHIADLPVFSFTINLNLLFDLYQPHYVQVKYGSNLIPVFKDISYVTPININTVDIVNELKSLPFISSFEYIDMFQINENLYSYTIRIYFNNDKTLSSEEIDKYLEQIHYVLIKLHCEIRK